MTDRQRARQPCAVLALGVVLGLVAVAAGAGLWLQAGAGDRSASVAAHAFETLLFEMIAEEGLATA